MKRKLFEDLVAWKDKEKRKPLILKGARQVGKTYLLEEFGKHCFPRTHIINFEKRTKFASIFEADLDPKRILEELSFHLNTPINPESDLIIFDEIQACPRALTSFKYFCEEMPQLALCSAGSLLGLHLGEASFPVGKVDFLYLYPMSFEEFLMAIDEQRSVDWLHKWDKPFPELIHQHIWERLKWYFIIGGLPEVVDAFRTKKEHLFEAFESVRKVQEFLITAYNADMAKHAGKVNAMHLDRLWKAIPNQIAQEQDGSFQRFKFKDVIPGIDRYDRLVGVIDWLLAAGLIIKVHITSSGQLPFSAHTKENAFKLMLFDVGLLGALSELTPKAILDYDYGFFKGYFAENFVAQEFIASGVANLYCWQEKKAEVEFLRETDGKVIPVEVRSGTVVHAKSLEQFVKKYASSYKVILSANNVSLSEQTRRYPLYLAGQSGSKDWL